MRFSKLFFPFVLFMRWILMTGTRLSPIQNPNNTICQHFLHITLQIEKKASELIHVRRTFLRHYSSIDESKVDECQFTWSECICCDLWNFYILLRSLYIPLRTTCAQKSKKKTKFNATLPIKQCLHNKCQLKLQKKNHTERYDMFKCFWT